MKSKSIYYIIEPSIFRFTLKQKFRFCKCLNLIFCKLFFFVEFFFSIIEERFRVVPLFQSPKLTPNFFLPPTKNSEFTLLYPGLPWYTLVYPGLPWTKFGYPWLTLVYPDFPWFTKYILQLFEDYTLTFSGLPCFTQVFPNLLQFTFHCRGFPWVTFLYLTYPVLPWLTLFDPGGIGLTLV